MFVKYWDGVASDGEIAEDRYIPIRLVYPLNEEAVGNRFSCYYRSTDGGLHQPKKGRGYPESMLELVVDKYSGGVCRLVLVSVLKVRYQDFEPGRVVSGAPVFDVEATLGDRWLQRDRVNSGVEFVPAIDQYEQYELWVGSDRFTILFEGRTISVAIQTGAHLIVFVDEDQEVCGFQITGVTPDQRAKIIHTITYAGDVIEGQDTFAGSEDQL